MSARDLDAAGIVDPAMRSSYERCRTLHREYGKTYYLATLLLPPGKRPYVWALYGFARYADEIVDDLDSALSLDEKAAALAEFGARFFADLDAGSSADPVCMAVIDTVQRWEIPREHFTAFLRSMTMDLTISDYADYAALSEYVYGSAAVIGLQMVPILEPTAPEAFDRARELGIAFQLANFVRDVGEDLDRGRIYLPLDELATFNVDRGVLEQRIATPDVKAALAYQIDRVKRLEENSRSGIELLHPSSRDCIEAARVLYCGIVDEVARNDYDVFTTRATVPMSRRLAVAIPAWRRARRARRIHGAGNVQGLHPSIR